MTKLLLLEIGKVWAERYQARQEQGLCHVNKVWEWWEMEMKVTKCFWLLCYVSMRWKGPAKHSEFLLNENPLFSDFALAKSSFLCDANCCCQSHDRKYPYHMLLSAAVAVLLLTENPEFCCINYSMAWLFFDLYSKVWSWTAAAGFPLSYVCVWQKKWLKILLCESSTRQGKRYGSWIRHVLLPKFKWASMAKCTIGYGCRMCL